MTKKERYAGIIDWFSCNLPVAETELKFETPFQLLVAVVLSAQCTDKRVNMITPELFRHYPNAEKMAEAGFEQIFDLIRSVSYPNNKTRHLMGLSRKLVDDFQGEVPSDIDSLMSLPGVGRKSANVLASIVYDKPVIAVDPRFQGFAQAGTVRWQDSPCCGTGSGKTHSSRTEAKSPPLADTPRPLHLHGQSSEMRGMRTAKLVP